MDSQYKTFAVLLFNNLVDQTVDTQFLQIAKSQNLVLQKRLMGHICPCGITDYNSSQGSPTFYHTSLLSLHCTEILYFLSVLKRAFRLMHFLQGDLLLFEMMQSTYKKYHYFTTHAYPTISPSSAAHFTVQVFMA